MRALICVPFSGDVQAEAIKQIRDTSMLVFPTNAAAANARRIFMPEWQLEEVSFLSMKEFKEALIVSDLPHLQDDKRLLCLWQVFTEDDRRSFHIYNYEDMILWGQSFFKFFEEMCDELVSVKRLTDEAFAELGTRLWQEEHLAKILNLRSRYRDFITGLGFSDRIFFQKPESYSNPYPAGQVIFVNQYYFSKLEKWLVQRLEDEGWDVLIIHQGLEDSFDAENLCSKPLRLEGITPEQIRLRELEIYEAPDQDQMILACLAHYGRRLAEGGFDGLPQRRALIDSDFGHSAYSRWFDPLAFRRVLSQPIQNTQLFGILALFGRHLEALARLKDKGFIPISELARALATTGWLQYYRPNATHEDKEKLLTQLQEFSNSAIIYIDLDLKVFGYLRPPESCAELKALLAEHFAILKHLSGISSLQQLIDAIDVPEGLMVERLCSQFELENTDILEQFYERLDNFFSIESLGLVKDWRHVFGGEDAPVAPSIWKLWLDSLGSATISTSKLPGEKRYEVSNLLDSRNFAFDELIFLNCVEGTLPENPEPVWLFNERQRGALGLKHYDIIRDWQRYYFLRLLFGSRKAVLYTYRDEEKDAEPGSFLTELWHSLEHNPPSEIESSYRLTHSAADLLSQACELFLPKKRIIQELKESGVSCFDQPGANDFFTLPSDLESDFGPGIKSAFYDLKSLMSNPFAWYIQSHRKLRERELLMPETISYMLFGSILHDFLSSILNSKPLEPIQQDLSNLQAVFSDKMALKSKLREILDSGIYEYKIPQNYNREFLFEIISDSLVQSVMNFYEDWLRENLRGKVFMLLPEEEGDKRTTGGYKTLLCFGPDDDYTLKIRGRADLRIHTDAHDYIIDFKSGGDDINQLIFYEYYYFLIDYDNSDRLKSLFWKLKEAQTKGESIDDKKRKAWVQSLKDLLTQCLISGYGIGNRVEDRKKLEKITRADLWSRTRRES